MASFTFEDEPGRGGWGGNRGRGTAGNAAIARRAYPCEGRGNGDGAVAFLLLRAQTTER